MKKNWDVNLNSYIRLYTQRTDNGNTIYECIVVTAHPYEYHNGFVCLAHRIVDLSNYFKSKQVKLNNETSELSAILSGFGFKNTESFLKFYEYDSICDNALGELALLICESTLNVMEKLKMEEALLKIRCITGINLNNKISIVEESAYNKIKALRTTTGMSQREFASHFCIPTRTLQEWEQKGEKQAWKRYPPRYVVYMIERILKFEKLID